MNANAELERMVAEERLILAATAKVCEALERRGVTRRELANRLGIQPAEVTQRLNGRRNLTLRSLAQVLHELGFDAEVELRDRNSHWASPPKWNRGGETSTGRQSVRYTATGIAIRAVDPIAAGSAA